MEITVGEAALACGGKLLERRKAGEKIPGICADTREIKPGEIFAALTGKNADGHSYIDEALVKGAGGVIASCLPDSVPTGSAVILVDDPLRALNDIAVFYRQKFDIPFIGITGSCGKTTVREMLVSVLSGKYKVLSSPKNYNNHLGLPLTVFTLNPSHTACVLEMGMSGEGELSALRAVARPGVGLITNVGVSHYGNFRDASGIARAKAEILPGLPAAVLNMDDDYFEFFRDLAEGEVRTFGLTPRADFFAEGIAPAGSGTKFLLNGKDEIFLPARGKHNVMNALSAAAAASFLGAGAEDFRKGLESFSPPPGRLQMKKAAQINVIDDSYNASPDSVEAAAGVLAEFGGRKIFVLGDMLELGRIAESCHHEAGRMIASKNFDYFLACGDFAKDAVSAANKAGMSSAFHFPGPAELISRLTAVIEPSDTVLVKGSRALGMEDVVEALLDWKIG